MLPSASTTYRADLLFRGFAFDLLRVGERRPGRTARPMLVLPQPWRVVAGSEIDTGVQRFVSFSRFGAARVDLYSAVGLGDAVQVGAAGRLIAAITFGAMRTAVHADPVRGGFEARWTEAETDYRLAAGPISLLDFMELLNGVDWPR